MWVPLLVSNRSVDEPDGGVVIQSIKLVQKAIFHSCKASAPVVGVNTKRFVKVGKIFNEPRKKAPT